MSRPGEMSPQRQQLLRRLAGAGREMSDAAVMFHSVLARKLGLGASDWKTLGLLERHGPLTAGELSARSGLAPPSVTGIIGRLERGGWVRRRQDPEDRRRVIVALDWSGAGEGDRFFAGLTRRLDELYERYDDEALERLLEFMTEVAKRQREATAELEGVAGAGTVTGEESARDHRR